MSLKKIYSSKVAALAFLAIVLALTYYRYISAISSGHIHLVDYISCYASSFSLYYTSHPFDFSAFTLDYPGHPYVFPGTSIVFYPFTLFKIMTGQILFMLINLALIPIMFYLFLKHAGVNINVSFLHPNQATFGTIAALFVYYNLLPIKLSLWVGQLSIFSSFFLIIALCLPDRYIAAALGISMIYKFSLPPPLFVLYLVKRKFWIVAGAIALFAISAMAPAFVGHSLSSLYKEYIGGLTANVSKGSWDSYLGHGQYLINLDFFRETSFNLAGKALFSVLIVICIIKEYRSSELNINTLLFLVASSQLLSYHRCYDQVLPLLLLLGMNMRFCIQKKWSHYIISSLFLLFYSMSGWVDHFSSSLVEKAIDNPWIYLVQTEPGKYLFPIHAFAAILLAAYSFYIWRFTPAWVIEESKGVVA